MSQSSGEMAEWSIAAVLKTVEVRASGGSNPSLSAKYLTKPCKSMIYGAFSLPTYKNTYKNKVQPNFVWTAPFSLHQNPKFPGK